ncbi:MAG: hypothetical protein K2G37_06665 [Clostridia bacterium]|nr:hypothetical protein [Clostridia bacterium]MDE7329370.1 hypothetical protein [Clostridia bacterium]
MGATNKLAENLVLKRDLSPEGRVILYKGRIREAMRVISVNMTKLVLLNIIMLIACIPLIVMVLYYQRTEENAILSGLNFSTGIGIGFGVQDDTALAISQIYDVRMKVYGLTLFPTCLLFGLFASGLYYCCRNMLWGAKIKIRKHFFRGIKAHWYKYVISFAWLGVLATGFACSLIAILKENALYGSANAGWWVLIVATGILALASAIYMIIGNGMYVLYKFKMNEYIKNTCSLALIMFRPAIILVVFFSGVMALFFVNLISVFLMIVMIMIGFSAFAVFSLAFSQYVCDNTIGYLYEEDLKVKRKEQEKQARAKNQAKKKQQAYNKKKRR